MKKTSTLFAFAVLFSNLSLHAQTEKGSVYVGGNIIVETASQKAQQNNPFSNVSSQIVISPSVAWAYKNNRLFGFSLSWSYQKLTDSIFGASGTYGYSMPSFGGSAFLRQYKPLGKGFYLYAQEALSATFGYGKLYGYDLHTFKTELLFSPGMAYNVSKHLQLEIQMSNILETGYTQSKLSGNGTLYVPSANGSEFVFISSLEGGIFNNLTFGVRYFL